MILSAALALLLPAPAQAGERLLFDGEVTLTAKETAFPSQLTNLVSPDDFRAGTLHVRYEVLRMAATGPTVALQCCLKAPDGAHTCVTCVPVTQPGVYTIDRPLAKMFKSAAIDYGNLASVVLVAKAERCDNHDAPPGALKALYYPLRLRATIVAVPAGATFSGWDHYPGSLPAGAPAPVSASAPARKPADLAALFCVACHGPNLTGGRGPNLLDAHWNHGGDPASVRQSIQRGWRESGMPALAALFTDAETRALVAWLAEQGSEFAAGRIAPPAPPPDLEIRSERQVFRLETYVADLDLPWGLAFLPDGQLLVSERPGRLRVVANGRLLPAPVRGTPAVFLEQDGGLFDVIAHPDYADNGWIYLAYSEPGPDPTASMTVVVRGRIRDAAWVDQQVIFRAPPERYTQSHMHYGCRLGFDRERHLFFTIGDRGAPDNGQDLASPCGKIHRVLDDGRIPPDNPFAGRPGACASVWSYGNRNSQGLAWHPVTGRLWASEHGPIGGDELNRIEPGRNYGWPLVSHGTLEGRIFAGTSGAGLESPVTTWTPGIAPAAITFYTGARYPRWTHQLFLTSLIGQQLRRLETDGDRVLHQEVLFKDQGRVRAIATGPDGLLYVALNAPGRIARLVPVADAAAPPSPAH